MSIIGDIYKEKEDKLFEQIRKVRDNFGDDKCWNALFAMLPEGYTPPKQDIPTCQSEGVPPPRWVKGLPDKPGVWILTTLDGYRFTITYRGGVLTGIKNSPISYSFGPIPREPND